MSYSRISTSIFSNLQDHGVDRDISMKVVACEFLAVMMFIKTFFNLQVFFKSFITKNILH